MGPRRHPKERDPFKIPALHEQVIDDRVQLTEKFGPLPAWAASRLDSASDDELKLWSKRILKSTTLEETLR